MAKGLPKNIISKYGITKKAWQVFRSKHPYKKTYKGGTSKVKTVKKTMARRRYVRKRRSRRTKKFSIATIGGLVAGFITPTVYGHSIVAGITEGKWEATGLRFLRNYTGIDAEHGGFNWNIMDARGLLMLLGGFGISKVCGWFGVNRAFANMPSPLNKLKV